MRRGRGRGRGAAPAAGAQPAEPPRGRLLRVGSHIWRAHARLRTRGVSSRGSSAPPPSQQQPPTNAHTDTHSLTRTHAHSLRATHAREIRHDDLRSPGFRCHSPRRCSERTQQLKRIVSSRPACAHQRSRATLQALTHPQPCVGVGGSRLDLMTAVRCRPQGATISSLIHASSAHKSACTHSIARAHTHKGLGKEAARGGGSGGVATRRGVGQMVFLDLGLFRLIRTVEKCAKLVIHHPRAPHAASPPTTHPPAPHGTSSTHALACVSYRCSAPSAKAHSDTAALRQREGRRESTESTESTAEGSPPPGHRARVRDCSPVCIQSLFLCRSQRGPVAGAAMSAF